MIIDFFWGDEQKNLDGTEVATLRSKIGFQFGLHK
jgi:hypothetical protein